VRPPPLKPESFGGIDTGMESGNSVMYDWLISALVWYSAPVIATLVSVLYFVRSRADVSLFRRVATSAHGVTVAALYILAMLVGVTRRYDPAFGTPFTIALLLPVVFIAVSFPSIVGVRNFTGCKCRMSHV
jgi:hypothetical protein